MALKSYFILLLSLVATSCVAHDDNYYRLHPQVLFESLKACVEKNAMDVNCQHLMIIGKEVNQKAYDLQMDPLGFGQRILGLQQEIAQQKNQLLQTPEPTLEEQLALNQQKLAQYLALVGWLESPEG